MDNSLPCRAFAAILEVNQTQYLGTTGGTFTSGIRPPGGWDPLPLPPDPPPLQQTQQSHGGTGPYEVQGAVDPRLAPSQQPTYVYDSHSSHRRDNRSSGMYFACKVCDRGAMSQKKVFRMSLPVVVIGFILLIPSVLASMLWLPQ
jgi:hypothetical protein